MAGAMGMDALIALVEECATDVYEQLGEGHAESVYENAMAVAFRRRGVSYEIERTAEIFYHGEKVGMGSLDLVVDGQMVVELKATASITKGHVSQAKGYMQSTGLAHGMVVCFPSPGDAIQTQVVG